ncbi:hypothetical protein JCM3770_005743 [Rhodotorula araucariae]
MEVHSSSPSAKERGNANPTSHSPSPRPPPDETAAPIDAGPHGAPADKSSPETTSTPHLQQGAFRSADAFPTLTSASPAHVSPAEVTEDAPLTAPAQAQHVDASPHSASRPLATYVLRNSAARPPPLSLRMTSSGDGAARLTHHPYPFARQYPPHARALLQQSYPPTRPEPRSVPMQRSPPPTFASPSLAAAVPTYAITGGQLSSVAPPSEGGASSSSSSGTLEKVVAADEARRAAAEPRGDSGGGDGHSRLDLLAAGASDASLTATSRKRERDEQADRDDSTAAAAAGEGMQSVRIIQTEFAATPQLKEGIAGKGEDKPFERTPQRRRFDEPPPPMQTQLQHDYVRYQNSGYQQAQALYIPYSSYGIAPLVAPSNPQAMQHFESFLDQVTAVQYGAQMQMRHQYPTAGPPPAPASTRGEEYDSDEEDTEAVEARHPISSPATRYGHPAPTPYRFVGPQYGYSPASQPVGSPPTVATSPSVALAQAGKRDAAVPLVSMSAEAQVQAHDDKQPFGLAPEEQEAAAGERKKQSRGVKCANPYPIDSIAGVKPFVSKLRWLLQHPDEAGGDVCWSESGQAVLVHTGGANEHLVDEVLPRAFGHSNIANFTRQFTAYSFLALKEPALSRELNAVPGARSTADNDSAAEGDAVIESEAGNPREWKAYTHQHSADDFAAVRADERAAVAQARMTSRAKRQAAQLAAGVDIEVGGGSSDEEGEAEEDGAGVVEENEVDGSCWFTRDSVDDMRLLGRLKPKASKGKNKSASADARTKFAVRVGSGAAALAPAPAAAASRGPAPTAAGTGHVPNAPAIAMEPVGEPAAARFDPGALGGLRQHGTGGGAG